MVDQGQRLYVDLCMEDPGSAVDVYLTTTLRTLTYVRMGALSLQHAQDSGKLQIVGNTAHHHIMVYPAPFLLVSAPMNASQADSGNTTRIRFFIFYLAFVIL